ncbi:ParA family protein [Porphyromonas levii]|uniref:ParA family protein n=1 Tax=Porphyromonas levii TaxID=28114 RepID=A0A4Y8WMZ4_9PORP|nr:ParA family protein [Porphyromonas levii]TFH94169.1 ParA family protein [Porphyromonas levii]TFH96680.1 ParA family protein [Porphyromonas levii]
MTKIISIVNYKGGVGKTTTSASLLAGLTEMGKRAIGIDLDGQANLTSVLGIGEQDENIYTALKEGKKMPIFENERGLKLVPSTLDLQVAELELAAEPGRELLLKGLLTPYLSQLDYVIIDCPPSLGLLTLNALTASTDVIIPIEAEPLSLKGMNTILGIIDKVKSRLNPDLKIMGVLVTKFDRRKVINREVLETAKMHYPDLVFKTIIRDNVKLAETAAVAVDIFNYDKNSNGAKDYDALCKEILGE